MLFPAVPTCHANEPHILNRPDVWERRTMRGPLDKSVTPPSPDIEEWFRHCSYCGSMHPEDLLKAIAGGAKLGGSDWKYGWPHKFYVESIPNPSPEHLVVRSSSTRDGVTSVEWGPVGLHHGKFYNDHITDDGFDDEARSVLIEALQANAGIRFEMDGGKLRYTAPRHGYQK